MIFRSCPLAIHLASFAVSLALLATSLPGQATPMALARAEPPAVELVESWPVETDLDHAHIPDAHQVWLEMVSQAQESLDFAEFYASNQPGSRLEEVIVAIEAAAARGVRVRFLGEEAFYETYPETLERLGRAEGVEMRRFEGKKLIGGVHHAKYFIVDGREAFVGSQNFDWRALEHIHELGVRIRSPKLAADLGRVFEMDWMLAGGAELEQARDAVQEGMVLETELANGWTVRPVYSPRDALPSEKQWDLPSMIELLDEAEQRVRVQLLSYRSVGYDGLYWDELEAALRRAAARGVQVQLLLSHWSQRPGRIETLQSLQALPNLEVSLATIPPWSGGFIPYGRVIHAKYLVVDGQAAWIGTSNWERSYFYLARNVGLLIRGAGFAASLDAIFEELWSQPYSEPVDPCRRYEEPRIGP